MHKDKINTYKRLKEDDNDYIEYERNIFVFHDR